MSLRRRLTSALAAVGALLLSGCGALAGTDSPDSPDREGSRTVAAALYPVEYVVGRVAGDAFEVENLTAPGGEPHDLELGVRETALVADSALLVHVGSFQPAVDVAAEQNAGGEVLDAAEVVDLVPFEEPHAGEHASEHAEHEEHGEHSEDAHDDQHGEHDEHDAHDDQHGEHDEHGERGEHGEHDPHFWHDPLRMAELGDAVADRLAEIDPDGAETFEANAADLRADLEELDQEFSSGLADCATDTVVTNHDAFGYLEKHGLELESIAGISPDAEPSPAALAALQDLIAEEGVTTVFSETLVSPETARTLAQDAGVRTDVLDTVEGLTEETADEDYLSLMRANLAALQEANRC